MKEAEKVKDGKENRGKEEKKTKEKGGKEEFRRQSKGEEGAGVKES